MNTTATNTAEVLQGFRQAAEWTKVEGQPDRIDVENIFDHSVDCLSQIHTDQGGGQLGFTGLIYLKEEYLLLDLASEEFVSAVHPGTLMIADSATAALRDDTKIIHAKKLQAFKFKHVVSQAVLGLMRGAIEEEYYEELKKPKQGYNGVTPKAFLEHLFTEYEEKTEEMQTKMHTDLQEICDLSGPSMNGFKLKQDKLREFLKGIEQECSNGMYI